MTTVREWTRHVTGDTGQDLVEYALLAAFIMLGAVAAVWLMGDRINTVLWQVIAEGF